MQEQTFDYVIVGAGAAGALLAARLSEDGRYQVCLLEAGPADKSVFFRMPAGFIKVVSNPAYTWPFQTEPTENTGQRRVMLIQGKVLGGGTSVNGMAYNRGQRRDFDAWAAAGNPGWGYDDLLPVFRSLEARLGGDPAYRGRSGEMHVTDVEYDSEICRAFVAACNDEGIAANPDINGEAQPGVAVTQANIYRGRRVSSASAFLRPAEGRRNLTIKTGTRAVRVLLSGTVATGVEVVNSRGGRQVFKARREVILSAGALNTPHLLQLSGIGRPEWLQAAGLPVVHRLDGVGTGLRDHYMVTLIGDGQNFHSINQLAAAPNVWLEAAKWFLGRRSILNLPVALLHYFFESGITPGDCDVQGIFAPASNEFSKSGKLDAGTGMTCAVWQHNPRSVGYVKPQDADYRTQPIIQPAYLEEEIDRQVLVAACRRTRAILNAAPLRRFLKTERKPGVNVTTDDEWLDYARRTGSTVYHPCGTARMGPDDDNLAVVDAKLRVHGLQNLRVIDASVMPGIPSGNTAAATMVVGAKGARMILDDAKP